MGGPENPGMRWDAAYLMILADLLNPQLSIEEATDLLEKHLEEKKIRVGDLWRLSGTPSAVKELGKKFGLEVTDRVRPRFTAVFMELLRRHKDRLRHQAKSIEQQLDDLDQRFQAEALAASVLEGYRETDDYSAEYAKFNDLSKWPISAKRGAFLDYGLAKEWARYLANGTYTLDWWGTRLEDIPWAAESIARFFGSKWERKEDREAVQTLNNAAAQVIDVETIHEPLALPPPRTTGESLAASVLEGVVLEGEGIEARLKAAAKKIKHSGDYGMLYYHPEKHEVHWTAADSDGEPEHTGGPEIIKLLKLDGIKHVEVGDEWSPDEDEGWKRLI